MRALIAAVLIAASTAATALDLSFERIYSAPDLNGPAPRALKLAPDGSRVTFLRAKTTDSNALDLWEYDIASAKTRLLVDSSVLAPAAGELSDAEKARRERARIANFSGIVEYQFSPDGKALLFPLGGELYLYDLSKRGRDAVRQLTHGEGFATDAKVSPRGRYVSFVRAQNLWTIELASGRALQISADGGGAVSNGSAEFVADEEMDRHTGYWWAPDDSAIAFTRVDEAKVPIQRRFEIYPDRTEVAEQRYPAAGEVNADVRLAVATIEPALFEAPPPKSAGAQAPRLTWIDLGPERDIYLARVDWLPDGKRLSFQRESRDQQRLDLIVADLRDGSRRTVLSETSKTWINLNDDLHFLKSADAFIWASERSGFKQLYLYGLDGHLIRPLSTTPWTLDAVLGIDEGAGKVFVAAPGPDALEKHVYAYALDGAHEPQRLTTESGWHEAVFAKNARFFVDTHSDPATPPHVRLFDAAGKRVAILEANALQAGHPYFPYAAQHRVPEFGTITGSEGQTLNYRMYKPLGFDFTRKYPVFVRVYGGPGRQLANKAWGDWTDQYMARHGFVVFSLDNRGTPRRGKAFEEPIHLTMGAVEVRDQLEGVKWLKAQSFVDPQRIGVFGWSYGGYMTVLMLAKASDQIAAGVAVAPVTDWRLYDTHYTERYLSTPQANAEGYERSGVFAHLDGLKSPLLLMHGMADDNVLFTNSTRLMAELQKRGVHFELMTYPGGKHALVGPGRRVHVYTTIADFFERKLK